MPGGFRVSSDLPCTGISAGAAPKKTVESNQGRMNTALYLETFASLSSVDVFVGSHIPVT